MDEASVLIKFALNETVQKINSGIAPTEALRKVAEEMDLNPNYIQRVGEATNVALTYNHFKTASDRSESFPIVDIPNVIESSLQDNTKTAQEFASEHFPINEAADEVFNYNRMLNNPQYKRAFVEISTADGKEDSYPISIGGLFDKTAGYLHTLQKQAETAEVEKVGAEFDFDQKFAALKNNFNRGEGYRATFDEFESQVYAKHGEQAVPYLDLLYKSTALEEERGVHDDKYTSFEPCKEAEMFDGLMAAGQKFIDTQLAYKEATDNFEYEREYNLEIRKSLGQIKQASEEPRTRTATASILDDEDPVMAEISKKKDKLAESTVFVDPVMAAISEKQAAEKEAADDDKGGFGLDKFVNNSLLGNLSDYFKGDKERYKGKPSGNMTLDNMERKLLLQELLIADPILSKVNPAKVVRAYEQLLRLSPQISKEKEVVRAELRAMVSTQSLSKYDADLLTKLDIGLLKKQISNSAFLGGKTDQFRL